MRTKIIALLIPSLAFAQNATETAQCFSPYYPFITSQYMAAALALIRDITIIAVLWVVLFKLYERHREK